MATFYSSFFSSGLMADEPPHGSSRLPASSATPRARTRSSLATGFSSATSSSGSVQDDPSVPSISVPPSDDRPRLRRRRSSLAGSSSPLATMKASGPVRNAAASVQRNLRARSGSDASVMSQASRTLSTENSPAPIPAPKPTGIIGRLRSGSVGTALRPRRGLRRLVTNLPALPPPTSPLPEVPPLPELPGSSARRPFSRRTQTMGNYELVVPEGSSHPMPGGSCGQQSAMEVDYPSPVDSSAFEWTRGSAQTTYH
ncbi:uncharacterized protein BXZ73DRAFT_74736 [Epithele typhae]|uniref:uncharacterized protein n=1 Tax=Epithele typhae TaxID=378194 RepID=UPI0020088FE6|nr:uncharacterized protein BXZ73DRAFT_74736 [Epithele typhae]KAH9942485.1 hypothetical protein BXZ73DRAFT_74736 [Epithele typhae]